MSALCAITNQWYATQPTFGRHPITFGECSVDNKVPFTRTIPLASTIKKTGRSTYDLRNEFLSYFRTKGHTIVAPSSIYPKRQEGSYFVNSGMNQFKPLLLQKYDDDSEFNRLRRAANSQPCIRIGGRFDDLNDVGYDTSHHTMFEMLGNWSFADYSKETACRQMWEFLRNVLGLPANSLYVTYFGGCPELGIPADDETRDIWLSLGVSDQKLLPFGMEHNFWRADQASGAGLCGPATEVHVDYTALSGAPDLRCARCFVNSESPQVVELWNCVFISHRFAPDGKSLQSLPSISVDTGMGLERLASVMQGTMTTYDTDSFMPLIEFIQAESTKLIGSPPPPYEGHFHFPPLKGNTLTTKESNPGHFASMVLSLFGQQKSIPDKSINPATFPVRQRHCSSLLRDSGYRVIADHSRALALAFQDGLLPGRQGIALKLRHLIYRAARASILNKFDSPNNPKLLGRLVGEVVRSASFGACLPEIEGPCARRPSAVTPEQAENIIERELHDFETRLKQIEMSFKVCMDELGPTAILSEGAIRNLISGHYGYPISWDMICAQARWYGFVVPTLPQVLTETCGNFPPARHRSLKTTLKQTVRHASSLTQLTASRISKTDDSSKYFVDRTTTDGENVSYVVRPVKAALVAILVPADKRHASDQHSLILESSAFFDWLVNSENIVDSDDGPLFGLVFDRTNFFSPCGGQASDIGFIKSADSKACVFKVISTENVTCEDKGSGWIIHWAKCLPCTPLINSVFGTQFLLCPETTHRTGLTVHHTAQHLLNWAFTEEIKPAVSSSFPENHDLEDSKRPSDSSMVFHPGSRVDIDSCVVKLTVFTPQQESSASSVFLERFIKNAEARCQSVIESDLPIRSEVKSWEDVSENTVIKRYPWENYPPKVRAVCIGGHLATTTDESVNDDSRSFTSAELCGGTHLERTGDLIDIVVIAVRFRNRSVKEFVAIAGPQAQEARNRGLALLKRISQTEAEFLGTPDSVKGTLESAELLQRLTEEIDRVLGKHLQRDHSTEARNKHWAPLPFLHRCAIERARKRLSGLHGSVKAALRARGSDPFEHSLADALSVGDNSNPPWPPMLVEFSFDNVKQLARTVKKIAPTRPIIVFHKNLAIFFHPQGNGKALEWASRTVAEFDHLDAVRVRAEAFRDGHVDPSGQFAVVSAAGNDSKSNVKSVRYFADNLLATVETVLLP